MLALATGQKTTVPTEVQRFHLLRQWGIELLGSPPRLVDILRLHRMEHAHGLFQLYANPKNWKNFSQADWRIIKPAQVAYNEHVAGLKK